MVKINGIFNMIKLNKKYYYCPFEKATNKYKCPLVKINNSCDHKNEKCNEILDIIKERNKCQYRN